MKLSVASLIAAFVVIAATPPVHSAEAKAAFFGMQFLDTSLGGETADELERLAALEVQLVDSLSAAGRYAFVDVAPVADRLDRISNIAHCNGCDADLARQLGAEVAITGEVQKTSNLILHIGVYVRDAETGALVGGGSTDIRGNTDETWRRGLDYLIRNRLLKQ